jgi:hypothetical protein
MDKVHKPITTQARCVTEHCAETIIGHKREQLTGDWIELRIKKHHEWYTWAVWHVAHRGAKRNARGALDGESERNNPFHKANAGHRVVEP